MPHDRILSVINLSISLRADGRILLKPYSFELCPGQSLILLGESGSGKTMTCNAVMGLLSPAFKVEGRILYGNVTQHDLLKLSRKQQERIYGDRIAYIPQNPMTALNPSLRVGVQLMEMLSIHKKITGAAARNRCIAALVKAGLEDPEHIMESRPYTLSGGMLQRVLIALVLMMDAAVAITDEPTTALDILHRNAVINAFADLKKRNTALLVVTHDFFVAKHLGGNLIILKDGEVVEEGTVEGILKNPQHPYTKELIWAAGYERDRYDA